MAAPPTVFIVCSDQARNGKTLLARVLVDFLLMEGRDPFCFDLGHPEPALRLFFPGRTAYLDFAQAEGQAQVFDTLLNRAGRDYVIDIPAQHLALFCEQASARNFQTQAEEKGFRTAVLYVVDREERSLQTAVAVEEVLLPDIFVPVANRLVGSALPQGRAGPGAGHGKDGRRPPRRGGQPALLAARLHAGGPVQRAGAAAHQSQELPARPDFRHAGLRTGAQPAGAARNQPVTKGGFESSRFLPRLQAKD